MGEMKFFPCEDREGKEKTFEGCIQEIYAHLNDDLSKRLFVNRLMYSLTKDCKYISDIVKSNTKSNGFLDELYKRGKDKIYIYGAGIKGVRLVNLFHDINWGGFIDKHKTGKCGSLPIFGLEEVNTFGENYTILVSITMRPHDIKDELISRGVKEENILVLREYDGVAGKNMYFEEEILGMPDVDKMFIDVGCFDGQDTIRYMEWCENPKAYVEAYEADKQNYSICVKALEKYDNVKVYNLGLAEKNEVRNFQMTNTSSSKMSVDGDTQITVVSLDKMVHLKDIGYIKMDIEGAELEAISGAKEIIANQRPKIAISIYHRREDIWEIPRLLLELNPNYKFYLRHYTVGVTDTVLYAVDEKKSKN